MKQLLTAAAMKAADARTIERGLPSMVLMERAAQSVVKMMMDEGISPDRVLVLAGTGNNGGDGIAIARILCEMGFRTGILQVGNPEKYSQQMREQLRVLEWYDTAQEDHYEAGRYSVVIDALFGVGLSREITGPAAEVIQAVNEDRDACVIAVDIPSGIHADTGAVCGTAVRADYTVTFAYGKPGLYLFPGASFAGKVTVSDIGIPPFHIMDERKRYLMERDDLKSLPPRMPDGNKGSFGKVLVIAGSRTICGAAYLSGKAALISGTGMVRILTEEANRVPLAASFPEALIASYDEDAEGLPEGFVSYLNWADSILIGPGIGTGTMAERMLRYVLETVQKPIVLDADALNLLASDRQMMRHLDRRCAVTPHMMEMSRLTGKSVRELKEDPIAAAESFADQFQTVCVLKDARTVIACPDQTTYLVAEGDSGLATAGSGDVLAGLICGLVTQYPEHLPHAAALADLLHALAGSDAAETLSSAALTASELLRYVCKYH